MNNYYQSKTLIPLALTRFALVGRENPAIVRQFASTQFGFGKMCRMHYFEVNVASVYMRTTVVACT